MNTEKLPNKWFEKAKEDLDLAIFAQNMHPVPISPICYHCEQSAEKALKGFLVACETEPPKTHDLVLLCKLCIELDSRFEQLLEPCFQLTPYGVNVRYPSDEELEETDMQRAILNSEKVYGFVTQIMMSEETQTPEESFEMGSMSM